MVSSFWPKHQQKYCKDFYPESFYSFLGVWLDFLSRNYWSLLDHDPMTSIWKKAISILVGNLNSGRCYLITAVLFHWLKLKPDRPDPTLLTYQPPYQGGRIEHAIPNEEFGMPTFYHQSDIFFDWTNAKRATTFIMRKIIATSKPWKEKGEEIT